MKAKVLWMLFPLLFLGILLTSSCSKTETANPTVIASFSFNVDSVRAGDTVSFVNASQNADSYSWNFGDGTISTLRSPKHIFTTNGIYTVSLIVNGTNEADTTSVNVVVGTSSVFPGIGITGAVLGDLWGELYTKYGTDTTYYRGYYSNYSKYLHAVEYKQRGIIFFFWTNDTILNGNCELAEVSLVSPYTGISVKGISIGSLISKAEEAYGSSPYTYSYNGTNYYYFDSQGVGFHTSTGSGTIYQIEIYPKTLSTSKLKSIPRSVFSDKNILAH